MSEIPEELIQEYAEFLYKQLWPNAYNTLSGELKDYWVKESRAQLDWLDKKGFKITVEKN